MFKPDIFTGTVTRNVHNVSLQSYMQQRCLARMLETTPTRFRARSLPASPNPARICPFWEGKKKEQRFTSRYLHEAGTRGGLGTPYPLFAGSHNTASMPPLGGGPTTPRRHSSQRRLVILLCDYYMHGAAPITQYMAASTRWVSRS